MSNSIISIVGSVILQYIYDQIILYNIVGLASSSY